MTAEDLLGVSTSGVCLAACSSVSCQAGGDAKWECVDSSLHRHDSLE